MKSVSFQTKAIVEYVKSTIDAGPARLAYDGLRVFQHKERMVNFLTGNDTKITPVTVEMWPSLSCNARCPTCPYRLSGARNYADSVDELLLLNPELSYEIVQGLSMAGVRSVIFTGGGEPLLHPQIARIVHDASQAGLAWGMFTNGLLLRPEIAAQLLDLKPRFLRVSLDAGSPAFYSHIYASSPSQFQEVVENIRVVAQIAHKSKNINFGLGFSLEPQIDDAELGAIERLLEQLLLNGGIGLVAFRPRVIHYKLGEPLCPQLQGDSYMELAERIKSEIIQPLKTIADTVGTRLDIKEGIFESASRNKLQNSCLSSPWMTNIDQNGNGYITAELAGTPESKQKWGIITKRDDFLSNWNGALRKKLHRQLINGDMRVPLAHRTSPIDAALQDVQNIIGNSVDSQTATEMVDHAGQCLSHFTNGDFI